MTCIAGVAENGKVWIGGDSAGISGWALRARADEKVFRKKGMLFGFTTSFRMGDLIRFAFMPPAQTVKQGDREYLCTTFIDALRDCFKDGGYRKSDQGVESGGTFLLGYRGRLYMICDDFQVGESAHGYDAVGSGHEVAIGALCVGNVTPRARVLKALHAAERHNAAVRGPFKVVSM